jgi:carbon storage regulator
MLVLTRKVGENVIIAGNIRVTIVQVKGDRVRVGVEAPPEVTVDRQEVHERRQEFEGPTVIVAPTDPCHPKGEAHTLNQ